MKKALLASTALVGAALLSAPAMAGSVGTGDSMNVKMSGNMWFQFHTIDEDISAGHGRGYGFDIPETELNIHADNTADNGIKYGMEVELEMNTDATGNADEIWAFLDGDFGHIRLGDNDDATNTMLVGAYQTNQGVSGALGGLFGLGPAFHNQIPGSAAFLARTDWQTFTSSDATKITYFSPRFSGFQVGASFTPDSGSNGASYSEPDNNASFEQMIGLGANYTGKFEDVGVSVSVLYETANQENSSGAEIEDLNVWYVGGKVDFAGFAVGANYADFGDSRLTSSATALGADSGDLWQVGVGYKQGPWGVSAWYSEGNDNPVSSAVERTITRWGLGAGYQVAPGWKLMADYNYLKHENIGGVVASSSNPDNEAQSFILTSMFSF